MSESTPTNEERKLGGSRFLWSRPEVLSREEHDGLGLATVDRPFAFSLKCKSIPLTLTEFRTAQAFFPIVFTEGEVTVPVAVVGVHEDLNLFVTEDGQWTPHAYVPAYLRTHPFALARAAGDRVLLVIDRDAPGVGENPELPFFDGDKLTDGVQQRVEFCRAYDAETQRTQAFCDRLVELDVLSMQSLRAEGSEQDLVRYRALDAEKFSQLDDSVVAEFFKDGSLASMMAHMFSLDRWGTLFRMRAERSARSQEA